MFSPGILIQDHKTTSFAADFTFKPSISAFEESAFNLSLDFVCLVLNVFCLILENYPDVVSTAQG